MIDWSSVDWVLYATSVVVSFTSVALKGFQHKNGIGTFAASSSRRILWRRSTCGR